MMPGTCVRFGFCAFSSSVRLLLLDHRPAWLKKAVPEYRLPPDLGTRFITGPPTSLSPRPPPTRTLTSSEFAVSYTYDDTPPLRAAATVMPLTVMRPSPATEPELIVLECALKNVIVGESATPLLSTWRPGVTFRS